MVISRKGDGTRLDNEVEKGFTALQAFHGKAKDHLTTPLKENHNGKLKVALRYFSN